MFSKPILEASVKASPPHRRAARRHRPGLLVPALLLALAACISGCATSPPPEAAGPASELVGSASADSLMQRAGAASADKAAALYLQAAWAYLEAGESAGVEQAFAALEPAWLDQSELSGYHLLSAAVFLQQGDPDAASQAFARVSKADRQSTRAVRISSALCSAEGDYSCALNQLMQVVAADDPGANEVIWQLLNQDLSMTNLNRIHISGEPEVLAGWRSLLHAVVTPYSLDQSRRAVQSWLDAHADHPAALIPPAAVTELLASQPASTRIALMLPISGPLSRAGEAVRDGFIAASLLADASRWLSLTVYDTASEPLPVLYERALADGADLLVGPLQKPAVQSLNELYPEPPTLLLNYLDADAVPGPEVDQVGLAIEDEASTIARRLQADGIKRALLFHNYEDWSLRARRTLTDYANSARTPLQLTVQPLTDMRTITEAVGTAMHVQDSQARKAELSSLFGTELEFLPRARKDVDAVVALVTNTEANALVPALRFHFADQLPVYASSQVARQARAGQLAALSGFHVSELPYFLTGDPLHAVLAGPFDLASNPFASLMALGSDAFRISERRHLADETGQLLLLGSTGLLRSGSDGRFSRELAWGRIAAGVIRQDTAPTASRAAGAF